MTVVLRGKAKWLDGLILAASTLLPANVYAGTLVAVNGGTRELIAINQDTGATTLLVGQIDLETNIKGLEYESLSDTLYGVGPPDKFVSINLISGATTVLGNVGFNRLQGLALNTTTGTLYATTLNAPPELISIDLTTGEGSIVGTMKYESRGLAYNSRLDVMMGVDRVTHQLFAMNSYTAESHLIGPVGFDYVSGLAYDRETDRLFGTDNVNDQFIQIDTSTGAGTLIARLDYKDVGSLAFVTDLDQTNPKRFLSGDFNLDGQVNGVDFLYSQRNGYGPPRIAAWGANYGSVFSSYASQQSVPEPDKLTMIGTVGAALLFRRFFFRCLL